MPRIAGKNKPRPHNHKWDGLLDRKLLLAIVKAQKSKIDYAAVEECMKEAGCNVTACAVEWRLGRLRKMAREGNLDKDLTVPKRSADAVRRDLRKAAKKAAAEKASAAAQNQSTESEPTNPNEGATSENAIMVWDSEEDAEWEWE